MHEELIKRKAVLDTLDRMDKALDTDRTVETYKELLEECFKVLPTVDAHPVIHAEWEQINKNEVNVIPRWKCSECGVEFECFDMDFEWCPRCGAKMDKENKAISDSLVSFCQKIIKEYEQEQNNES